MNRFPCRVRGRRQWLAGLCHARDCRVPCPRQRSPGLVPLLSRVSAVALGQGGMLFARATVVEQGTASGMGGHELAAQLSCSQYVSAARDREAWGNTAQRASVRAANGTRASFCSAPLLPWQPLSRATSTCARESASAASPSATVVHTTGEQVRIPAGAQPFVVAACLGRPHGWACGHQADVRALGARLEALLIAVTRPSQAQPQAPFHMHACTHAHHARTGSG